MNPFDSSEGNENGTYEVYTYGVLIAPILSEEMLERNCPKIKLFLEWPHEAVLCIRLQIHSKLQLSVPSDLPSLLLHQCNL